MQGKAGTNTTRKVPDKAAAETSPQKVGVVSSVLPTGSGPDERTPFFDVVAKRFGPSGEPSTNAQAADAPTIAEHSTHSKGDGNAKQG